MRLLQEVPGIGAVVPHHAEQRRAVALPVGLPQACGLGFVDVQMAADVRHHRYVYLWKDVRAGVVQRVVEVE